jgi:hypothetical protein
MRGKETLSARVARHVPDKEMPTARDVIWHMTQMPQADKLIYCLFTAQLQGWDCASSTHKMLRTLVRSFEFGSNLFLQLISTN